MAGNLECLTEWCKRKFEGKGPELDGFFKEVCLYMRYTAWMENMLLCALNFRLPIFAKSDASQ